MYKIIAQLRNKYFPVFSSNNVYIRDILSKEISIWQKNTLNQLDLFGDKLKIVENKMIVQNGSSVLVVDEYYNIINKVNFNNSRFGIINDHLFCTQLILENELFHFHFYDNQLRLLSDIITPYSLYINSTSSNPILFFNYARKNSILYYDVINSIELWKHDFNLLKGYVESWKTLSEDIIIGNEPIYHDNIILIPLYNKSAISAMVKLFSLDTNSGKINYISDANVTNYIYKYKDKIYSKYYNLISEIDLHTGSVLRTINVKSLALKFSSQKHESSKFWDSVFFVGDDKIILFDKEELNFVVIDLYTEAVEFAFQFTRNLNIDKNVLMIYPPKLYNGMIYVSDNKSTLHIFGSET